jgi:pimeloyl-ACP methyl ester carboxylesterase
VSRVGTVTVPGGELYVEVAGDGPNAIVLLHPGLWDRRTWDREFWLLAELGSTVVRYDARGYGKSSRPVPGEPYSPVRDLLAVLDAQGIDRAALVGCSMGGATAIDAAVAHPERFWALVAVAPGLHGFESSAEEDERWDAWFGPIQEAVEAGDLQRAQDLRLEIWAPLGTDDEAGRRIREIAFDNLHELTMDEGAAESLDPPAATRLGEISTPTLVILAGRDPPDMLRIGDHLRAGIAGATVLTIEDADHVVNLRTPEAFDAAVLPFLARHAP